MRQPAPKMLAHLEHAFAYRLHVTEVAKLGLAQPLDEALPCQPVLQTFEPVGELIELFHRADHETNCNRVITYCQSRTPESFDKYSPMVSRLLHLMIIDILATCVALRIGGNTLQPLLREMKSNLRTKRYT